MWAKIKNGLSDCFLRGFFVFTHAKTLKVYRSAKNAIFGRLSAYGGARHKKTAHLGAVLE
jgi:hypothetical protein